MSEAASVDTWSVDVVGEWFRSQGATDTVVGAVKAQKLDGSVLRLLDRPMLIELGVDAMGTQLKILMGLKKLYAPLVNVAAQHIHESSAPVNNASAVSAQPSPPSPPSAQSAPLSDNLHRSLALSEIAKETKKQSKSTNAPSLAKIKT